MKKAKSDLPVRDSVRVVIVDDHHVVRFGLRALLEVHPKIHVAGEAATGQEALAVIKAAQPGVVLLDLRLPDMDGLELCREVKALSPAPAVLILTSYADDRTVLAAIEAGADGYLLKQAAGQDIPSVILTVAQGGSVLDPVVTRRVLQAVQLPKPLVPKDSQSNRLSLLTPREERVLELVALGKSNKQIAHDLHLSEGTARNYLSTVFSKLGVENRVAAASLWLRQQADAERASTGQIRK